MEGHVKIAIIENEFEAQLLQSALDEQGIEYYIKSYYDIAYNGLFVNSHGWGAVYSLEKNDKIILEVIKDIRKQAEAVDPVDEDDR